MILVACRAAPANRPQPCRPPPEEAHTPGAFANYRILPELTLNARIDYLSLTAGDYRGRLVNAQIAAVCRLSRNIGVGLSSRSVDYRVDVDKDRYAGRFSYDLSGPAAILQVGF